MLEKTIMTIVVYELTCPHDRREILIVIEITINVSFFFSPSWKRWRASNSPSVVRASSVLVILYHAGTFHASKRRKMTKWKLAVFRGILVVDTRYKELGNFRYTHSLFKILIWSLPEIWFKLNSSLDLDTTTWVQCMQQVYLIRVRHLWNRYID